MTAPTLALLHGFLGFSRRGPIEYFRGVGSALRERGIAPLTPEVRPAGTIAERAEALARTLLRGNAETFALVAHSMGGLDARYLIGHLDPDRRIRSLVTVATPHRGSPVAAWALEARGMLPAWIRLVGRPGLDELTPEARLAAPIPDRPDVSYASYAAQRPVAEQPPWLRAFGRIMGGANDGMVPVESAYWGEFRGILRADHVELLGWSLAPPDGRSLRPFRHADFWVRAAMEAMAAARPEEREHE
ncbi:triacylglycerol lipase [Nitrosovibrio sp. Nv17]|uniref:esterase/lipase family protein n=1 Tax=Nitrosovibrio sp. Nv17 TaxID=1855339 RepID=UPI000908B3C4|nr:thioesterase [Nitrosovibrio sp. Nv17]SFW30830.1 triacylglycerol lipase [Nitrosovibrio sp. Nv17]